MIEAKFSLGQLVATPGALAALEDAGERPSEFLRRHVAGDWGDVSEDDWEANDDALDPIFPSRLFSAYHTRLGVKLWIITERDRSVTTVLRPEDY